MRVLFDVADLRKRGFTGFVPVAQPKPALPTESGVYVVAREANDAPHFLAKSDAPTYKGKDPTVPIERLVAEWVDGAQTVYIGDATSLRHRVGQLGRFAAHGNSLARWGERAPLNAGGGLALSVQRAESRFPTLQKHARDRPLQLTG
jgi:hypothetical protein